MKPREWSDRYRSHNTKWDLGQSPEQLVSYIVELAERKKVLIPGCGRGYEIKDFHEASHEVTAIDFSEGAIEASRQVIGDLADKIICDDFFKTPLKEDSFDICYERNFFCAISMDRWKDYGPRIASLLSEAGILIGIFQYGKHEDDGPPFPMTLEDRERYIEPYFLLLHDEFTHSGLSLYNDHAEHWQVWQKR